MAATIDPFTTFDEWLAAARRTEPDDPTACALATVDSTGCPHVRMVLLKGSDARRLVFYTNLNSPKAADLRDNPSAALCFHWARLGRQVRIEGEVVPVAEAEADAYFATRPRLSQLGAWASCQSEPMPDRFGLEREVAAMTARFPWGRIPRPPHWSGFRVVPALFEFWIQRPFRHHERRRFTRDDAGAWREEWLFP